MIKYLLSKGLSNDGWIYSFMQSAYHELKFIFQRIYFILVWPRVTIYRLSMNKLKSLNIEGYRSQFGQDFILDRYYLNRMKKGVFIDVGCNHPERISNSYFFEKTRKWNGLAFDPLLKYYSDWQKERKNTKYYGVALGNEEKNIKFIEIDAVSGWEDTLSAIKGNERKEDLRYPNVVRTVQMKRLSSFLSKGMAIDLLLIDVEGAEYDALLGMNLSVNRPKIIVLENSIIGKTSNTIRKLLIKNKYKFVGRVWTADDIFIYLD